jgi:hypothetical protein
MPRPFSDSGSSRTYGTGPRDLEYILGKYRVTDPDVTGRLFDWCRNGRKKGWWQRYATDLSPEMMDFIGLEADATSVATLDRRDFSVVRPRHIDALHLQP